MKKSEILDGFTDRVRKQNPWAPYVGDAGGEGWVNQITGEIRYQDARPTAQEGMEEGEEVPEDYEEPEQYQDVESIEDWKEPDIDDWADHIDGVTDVEVDIDGEIREGNPVGVDEETGTIEVVDHENFETYHVTPEEIATHPLELEPEFGWAEGWTDPPDDVSDLETGQEVEVFDFERGEYVQAEVRKVDDWGSDGMYVDIHDEETGEIYEFIDGEPGSATDAMVTAQENLFRPETVEDFDSIDYDGGDEVVLFDELEGEFREGEVMSTWEDEILVNVGDQELYASEDSRYTPLTPEGVNEYELAQMETIDEQVLLPDNGDDLAEYEGYVAQVEHPAEGAMIGMIDIVDHDEQGRHAYIGESEVGIPIDNPDHPLSQFTVDAMESPYNDFSDEFLPFLDPGDELVVSEGGDVWTASVTDVSSDGSAIEIDGKQFSADELAEDGYDGADITMTSSDLEPNPPEGFDWDDPGRSEDIWAGDDVWFDTTDVAVPTHAEVVDVIDSEYNEAYGDVVVEDGEGDMYEVSVDNLEGHAETSGGLPDVATEPAYAHPGEGVEVAYREVDGSVETFEGMILSEPDDIDGEFAVRAEDGEIHRFTDSNSGQAFSIVEDGVDVAGGESSGVPPEEVAEEIEESLDLHYQTQLDQQKKDELKGSLFYHHDADDVSEFYDLQSGGGNAWKYDSGTREAANYEEAFRESFDIDAPGRGDIKYGGSYASPGLRKVAQTAAELSQRHFENTYGSGTTLDRGTSPSAAQKLFGEYLANPAADEYNSPFLAINNFSTSRHTAERFEGDGVEPGAVVSWETDAEDVVAMHDYLFTEEGEYEGEGEITIRGDMDAIPAENIDLNASYTGGGEANFGKLPEEWSYDEAKAFEDFASRAGTDLLDAIEWNEGVVRNAMEIESVLEDDHGISTTGNGFFDEVGDQAAEMDLGTGYDPDEGVEFDDGFREFDSFDWNSSEIVGHEVRYEDAFGDEHEAEVLAELGGATFETDLGDEVSVSDITDIRTEEPTSASDFDVPEFDVGDLDSGDRVTWVGHDGINRGEFSYAGDSGDFVYVEDADAAGGVATVSVDDIIDVPGGITDEEETMEASGFDDWDIDLGTYVSESDVESITPGDEVKVSDDFVGDELELDVVDVNDEGIPIVTDEEKDWDHIPIDQNSDWTIEAVQEGEPGILGDIQDDFDGMDEDDAEGPDEPPDPGEDEFHPVDSDLDALSGYEGEWVWVQPDEEQFPMGVVGRLDDAQDVGPGGTASISDIESLGPEEFPMSSYTGALDEVEAVYQGGDEEDFDEDLFPGYGSDDGRSEESDSNMDPSDLHDADPGVGEAIDLTMPDGVVDTVEVVGTSVDPNAPIEVQDGGGNELLVWPGGDVEPV